MKINPIDIKGSFEALASTGKQQQPSPSESFSSVFGQMISDVNASQQSADKAIQSLATGEAKGLHEVMIAVEKSAVSFQFLAQVRSKVVEAYQEIMRLPV